MSTHEKISALIEKSVEHHLDTLIGVRRQVHTNPELAWCEVRTCELIAENLASTTWRVRPIDPTGLVADLEPAPSAAGSDRTPIIALRADLDALPIADTSGEPWASLTPGVAHACGHDLHAAALLGAAMALNDVAEAGLLRAPVRLIFQPAEEVMPGGALRSIAQGALDGVGAIFALHCDPSLDVGQIGLRAGPITGAADRVEVRLSGAGGHTARPHLTEDLVFALGKVITELPAVLSRRLDPRSGVSVVWGMARAGSAANVVPDHGMVAGTVRMLDSHAWTVAESLVCGTIAQIVAPYEVTAEVAYTRGVPPVINDRQAISVLGAAATAIGGPRGVAATSQSLGGEDFGWYVDRVPGAMARLGVRTPGGTTYDLHQGNLRVDDRAIAVGARLLAEVAVRAESVVDD
ncbi:MAG: amidohydrolase [Nocardioides sp.]